MTAKLQEATISQAKTLVGFGGIADSALRELAFVTGFAGKLRSANDIAASVIDAAYVH